MIVDSQSAANSINRFSVHHAPSQRSPSSRPNVSSPSMQRIRGLSLTETELIRSRIKAELQQDFPPPAPGQQMVISTSQLQGFLDARCNAGFFDQQLLTEVLSRTDISE